MKEPSVLQTPQCLITKTWTGTLLRCMCETRGVGQTTSASHLPPPPNPRPTPLPLPLSNQVNPLGGRIAVIFRTSLSSHLTVKSDFAFTHSTFELVQISITLEQEFYTSSVCINLLQTMYMCVSVCVCVCVCACSRKFVLNFVMGYVL